MSIFRLKQLKNEGKTKRKALNIIQKNLEEFQSSQEKQSPIWPLSIRVIENEVNDQLKAFQQCVREIKDSSVRLEELTKLLKSGEISENIYKILLDELSDNLSPSIEQIFKIRENLEVLRARAKIEWAKEKIGISKLEVQEFSNVFREDLYYKEVYSPVYKWQEIINRINSALSSLTFEEELSIIERYLLIVRERDNSVRSKEVEEAKQICRQRLNILSENWASIRRDKISQIMDLELKASQLKDEIKELEVRFTVGEISRNIYETKISTLQGSLRKIEKEMSEIRSYIDEIDLKIFRISELLRENV